jgi:hypothetical protein
MNFVNSLRVSRSVYPSRPALRGFGGQVEGLCNGLRRVLVLSILLGLGSTANAQDRYVLDIDSRSDRFLVFYRHATSLPMDADARFALWKVDDGLAAVPPGPEGDAMARKLLDGAWDRYPALIERLPVLHEEAERTASVMFVKDNDLLGTGGIPIRARVVLYVGQFDDNAYTMPSMDGKPITVMLPVENKILQLALAHELSHAIHMQLANIKNSFGAPVGETVFLEGLAMRTAQRAVPGLDEAEYTEMPQDRGWFQQCQAHRRAILAGIAVDFNKSGAVAAQKYTFGTGNLGLQREAYCAGWFLVGNMLARGARLSDLARIPEERLVSAISEEYRRD